MVWHGLVIGSSGSHSSPTSSPPTSHPSATSRLEHRVSIFSQSLLSLAGCLLPNYASSQSYFKLCFLLVNCHESSSLFSPLAPRLAASVVAHWGGNRTVPWPLVLILLASAELCSTGPASPAWSSRETSVLSGLDPGDPLGLKQDVPWASSRNP